MRSSSTPPTPPPAKGPSSSVKCSPTPENGDLDGECGNDFVDPDPDPDADADPATDRAIGGAISESGMVVTVVLLFLFFLLYLLFLICDPSGESDDDDELLSLSQLLFLSMDESGDKGRMADDEK